MNKKSSRLKTIDTVYIGIFAAIIAVCSWLSIPIGTVPITLQTMAVCITAGLLGAKKGTLTVIIYILLGAIGVPVFAGFSSGFGYILGATGGYMVGFVFTALTVGIAVQFFGKKLLVYLISMIIGIFACYIFGTAWFIIVYNKSAITAESVLSALSLCVVPYIVPDLIKAFVAAFLCTRLYKYIN